VRNINVHAAQGVGRSVVGFAPEIEVFDGDGIEVRGEFAPGWVARRQTLGVSRK
jgi:hypothetical protein